MLDFLMISSRRTKSGAIEVYPKFVIKKSSDLMIRGGDFYAIWIEDRNLWSTDEQDALQLIDREISNKFNELSEKHPDTDVRAMHMWDSENGMIDRWHKYCQKHMRDQYHMLDEKLIFSNTDVTKEDYASKKLSYPLEEGSITAYDKLISTLYSEEERHKIEWAIGSIVSGESKKLQKFMVLYGAAGTGKSTILNIIQQLFEGYYSVFDAKALGSSSNSFALEAFKTNPLVAIQHDGDLSKIEDNTRLNSLVSHELMTVNEKFKSSYENRFKSFLFMGTNKPVKITDGKSGLLRRLIDVSPSGNKLSPKEYKQIVKQVSFELGAIAHHCMDVFRSNPGAYDDYVPTMMLSASNDFYNYIIDSYSVFKKEDGITLKAAWEMYKTYCDEAKVPYPFSQRSFKEELKNYFWDFKERITGDDGSRIRSYYSGFRLDKFEDELEEPKIEPKPKLIQFKEQKSIFDVERADCIAQYANDAGTPAGAWDFVTSKLSEIDTSKLHYVAVPENHIVIDFDLKDENGKKSLEKNIEEASKWPDTYAELSKSGCGVHLHYIYSGDVTKLSRIYSDNIEVKVFTGKSSLRRKLTKCNDLPIATISSGLPLRGENKLINFDGIKSEKALRTLIKRHLNKEIMGATKPSIDMIYKALDEAYASGMCYDVTDMQNAVFGFAAQSSNQADICLKLVSKMKFKSEQPSEAVNNDEEPIVFYDIEVFPNLFLVNWKFEGEGKPVVRMINPKPTAVEELMRYRLVGFNCRRYDNHILYAAGMLGYNNERLYDLSQRIVNGDRNAFFGEAYNVSYTDVYDFCSTKQSLKKWEIELGIHHQELGLPWDQPVPQELWPKVAEYCDNDVIATEAVFNARKADFVARQILAKLANSSVNDTTNSLSAKIIFGKNRKPQDQFQYRDMGDLSDVSLANYPELDVDVNYVMFDSKNRPLFPGYKFEHGVSTYRDEKVGEGGYVYSEPGMYGNVALLDVASMHPSSIIAEQLFGPVYTKRFEEIRNARVAIKHKDYESAKQMLDGALVEYINELENGATWFTADDLAQALKIVINSIYGLTAANFDNPFRDKRNRDNIVAKRGALFMINLKNEVQKRGFVVAHVKTDSIKIPDATPEIIQFVMDFGQLYGYTFEHEATYDRMCLVNDAVYIAKYKDGKHAGEWTATGTQFAVPYVYKKLFTKDDILFEDMCETKSVATSLHLDMNEKLPEGEHAYHFVGKVGSFCPIKPGAGGGELLREGKDKDGNIKYHAATGAKGHRWLESEMVKQLGKEDDIDRSYYDNLANDAADAIAKFGDFEWFVSDDPYISPEYDNRGRPVYHPEEDDVPWDVTA